MQSLAGDEDESKPRSSEQGLQRPENAIERRLPGFRASIVVEFVELVEDHYDLQLHALSMAPRPGKKPRRTFLVSARQVLGNGNQIVFRRFLDRTRGK